MMKDSNPTIETKVKYFVLILRDLTQEETNYLNSIGFDYQSDNKVELSMKKSNNIKLIDLDNLYTKSYEDAYEQILRFGELKLNNGNELAKHLQDTDGKSLWYYIRIMALYKYRKKIYEFRLQNQLKKIKESYKEVLVYHSSSSLQEKLIEHGIRSSKRINKEKKFIFLNSLRYMIAYIIRVLVGFTQLKNLFRAKRIILLSNADVIQKVIRKSDFKEIKGDHIGEYLQEEIQGEKDFLNISEFFPPNLKSNNKLTFGSEVLFSRFRNTLNLEIILFLQFFNPWFYWRAIKAIFNVRKMFASLSLTDHVLEEEKFIIPVLYTFKRLCFLLVVRKVALMWLFKIKKIEKVGGINEHDPRVKSILETAQQFNVKTYGIQHGVIHSRHIHYCFTAADKKYEPYPDMTFLWGSQWKKTLIEDSIYDEFNIEIVGQIRSDIIEQLNQIPKSNLIGSLDSNRKIILYPSQPLYSGDEGMRRQLATDFLKLTLKFSEIQFVIKPHPKELDCETFIDEIAKSIGTSNYQVLRGDLYKILAASDLVIVYNSTVGAEAIYFNKPLLVMDYSKNDFSGFITSGVGIRVEDYLSLEEKVHAFQEGKLITDKTATERFISERAFAIDGRVSKRIIDSLKKSNA